MRLMKILCVTVVTLMLSGYAFGSPQAKAGYGANKPAAEKSGDSSRTNNPESPEDLAIDRIIVNEHSEVATINLYQPIMEVYLQEIKKDKEMGAAPYSDRYELAQVDLKRGIALHSMLPRKFDPLAEMAPTTIEYRGFLQMAFVDPKFFDKKHYKFEYAGRDFLGSVRCLMFDVAPLPKAGDGRFKGRIWVEDRNYRIVRFNGIFNLEKGFMPKAMKETHYDYTHFDSWRCNLRSDVWLPCYIFSELVNPKLAEKSNLMPHPLIKAQVRFWGYSLGSVHHEEEFSELTIDAPGSVTDDQGGQDDLLPVEAQREWRRQAEGNVVDSLQKVGLLAPAGPVDKILDTVVNNIEISNKIEADPEIHCRVLLTSTLEFFSMGHTIVVSRGLLDVLPNEAALAAILSQGISDALVPKPFADDYGFNDTTLVSTTDVLKRFSFRDTKEDYSDASGKAVELLRNSPYTADLPKAGLFLKELNVESKTLRALISPNLGNRVNLASELMSSAPNLEPTNVDQIAALPIGARIKLDAWSDRVEMNKSKPVALESAREKMPLEITPFFPYLTRVGETSDAKLTSATKPEPGGPAVATENQ